MEEWRAFRVRCRPGIEHAADEAELFERLQDIGAWYLSVPRDASIIVLCVRLDDVERRRDAALAELRRQGLEPSVEAEGKGFAQRDRGGLLEAYRIEIDGEILTGP